MPLSLRLSAACVVIALLAAACAPAASTPTRPPTLAPPPPSATAPRATSPASQPRAVMIDTDMAADDWMAILYLLQRPDVKVIAITVTGAGEAHCDPGIRNVLGLVALAGYDPIPVACGRETPLRGNHVFPQEWRDGVDSLFGLTLPEGQNPASSTSAVELLTSAIASSPQKVTLLTLGPLTNIAELAQTDPAAMDGIAMIYVMGGAVDVPGNIAVTGVGIDNAVAEWNIYIDPHAANVVFDSGAPITLVPLNATNQAPLTREFYQRVEADHITPAAAFVFDVLTQMRDFIESGGYYFWDPLAAAVMADESLATVEGNNICVVEEEGPSSGATNSDAACSAVRVAMAVERARFEQEFLDALNGK